MQDLLGATGIFKHFSNAVERHQLAAGGDHREVSNVLSPPDEAVLALDDQVDPVASEKIVGGIAAIDQAINHIAELSGVEPHVG